jgi:hypothetical protein
MVTDALMATSATTNATRTATRTCTLRIPTGFVVSIVNIRPPLAE